MNTENTQHSKLPYTDYNYRDYNGLIKMDAKWRPRVINNVIARESFRLFPSWFHAVAELEKRYTEVVQW